MVDRAADNNRLVLLAISHQWIGEFIHYHPGPDRLSSYHHDHSHHLTFRASLYSSIHLGLCYRLKVPKLKETSDRYDKVTFCVLCLRTMVNVTQPLVGGSFSALCAQLDENFNRRNSMQNTKNRYQKIQMTYTFIINRAHITYTNCDLSISF